MLVMIKIRPKLVGFFFLFSHSDLKFFSPLRKRGLRCRWTGGGAISPGWHITGLSDEADSAVEFVLRKLEVLGLMGM